MLSLGTVFAAGGPLSTRLPGYRPRPQQQEMAERIATAIEADGLLVCEAGTGTGKTFAYLVPALLSGARVIVSTGTRHLQDQLYHKDLPLVREALGLPVRCALLKGRANYLCPHRLDLAIREQGGRDRHLEHELAHIRQWAARTATGDIAECEGVGESSRIWPKVTSTTDNCLGQKCPRFEDCHLRRARQEAAKAELLVVNHHLFLADMALRETGFGEVLPGAEAVIFDEAHLLPEIAPQFFGQALGSRQLEDLARDARLARIAEAPELLLLDALTDGVISALRNFRLSFGIQPRRGTWVAEAGRKETVSALMELGEALGALGRALQEHAERGETLESCARRAALQTQLLRSFSAGEEGQGECGEGEWVEWFETTRRGFHLYRTPVDVGAQFSRHRESFQCAWVFTSATLAVNGRFAHFQRRLGLERAETACWDSPFDYARQTLLYLPGLGVDPGNPAYTRAVVEVCRQVLPLSRGRAFLLFTSHRALQEAARLLEDLPWPVLVQGEAPRPQLLQRFRELGDAVLLGTSSFWEGVDVRGEALSCVIIDKLPFAAPDDPVLQARLQAIRREGGNPFMEHQVPEAVILLKQGAGRLIRDPGDRGLLVLCDPRLRSRPYGRVFLDSLPPMPRTGSLEEVGNFFATEPG